MVRSAGWTRRNPVRDPGGRPERRPLTPPRGVIDEDAGVVGLRRERETPLRVACARARHSSLSDRPAGRRGRLVVRSTTSGSFAHTRVGRYSRSWKPMDGGGPVGRAPTNWICVVSRARRRRDPLLRIGHAQGLRPRPWPARSLTGWPVAVPGAERGCEPGTPYLAPDGTIYVAGDKFSALSPDGVALSGWPHRPTSQVSAPCFDSECFGGPVAGGAHRSRRHRIRRALWQTDPSGVRGGGGRARSPGSAEAGMALPRAVRCVHCSVGASVSPDGRLIIRGGDQLLSVQYSLQIVSRIERCSDGPPSALRLPMRDILVVIRRLALGAAVLSALAVPVGAILLVSR